MEPDRNGQIESARHLHQMPLPWRKKAESSPKPGKNMLNKKVSTYYKYVLYAINMLLMFLYARIGIGHGFRTGKSTRRSYRS